MAIWLVKVNEVDEEEYTKLVDSTEIDWYMDNLNVTYAKILSEREIIEYLNREVQ